MGNFEELFKYINNKAVNKFTPRHNYYKSILKSNSQVKKVSSRKVLSLTAGILAGSILLGSAIAVLNRDKEDNIKDIHNITYTGTTTPQIFDTIHSIDNNIIIPHQSVIKSLDELTLETSNLGALTSDSVKNLSSSIVYELNDLYELGNGELPPVIESETLSSLFFCENTCKPIDTEGSYIGIGQMGVDAIQNAIDKVNKLYNKAIKNGVSAEELENNYLIKNIANKDALELFEKAKTDPKLCGALSAASLAWISDSLYTAFGENKDIIIMSYNAGIGNMQNLYMEKGIVTLSPDKKHVAIDLSKVNTLSEKQLSKFNEAITYLIRVNGGSKILKESPNADILEILEKYRVAVGSNANYNPNNSEQFKHIPNSVTVSGINEYLQIVNVIMDQEMER